MATTTIASTRVPQLSRLQMFGIIAAVVGLGLLGFGFFANGALQFFESYLFGFYFTMSLPLGCLGFLMLQHLTGGAWGVMVRRMLEAGAAALPIMGLLFIPIVLATFNVIGLPEPLYEWANPALVTVGSPEFDPGIYHKLPWLTPQFFAVRALIYFVIWSGLALTLRAWSLQQDRTNNTAMAARMRVLSGIGVALFVISITFASFDWAMSLDPHWFSSMYGAHYMISSGLLTLAFLILVLTQVRHTRIFTENVPIKPIHDLGKLMLAFTILWTYASFAQYVIIWSGDIAESTPWYLHRMEGGWLTIVPLLMLLQFFVPFFLLLSRRNKRNLNSLAAIAALIVVMRFVDMSWIVLPDFHKNITEVAFTDLAAPLGLVGLWLAIFAWNLQRAALLPLNDPNMEWLQAGGHH